MCRHGEPSIVDHRTLERSNPLPISFLRERLIAYLPTLFNQAIQYYSCFISYSTKDQDFAERIDPTRSRCMACRLSSWPVALEILEALIVKRTLGRAYP
jgi:hypothetical protein